MRWQPTRPKHTWSEALDPRAQTGACHDISRIAGAGWTAEQPQSGVWTTAQDALEGGQQQVEAFAGIQQSEVDDHQLVRAEPLRTAKVGAVVAGGRRARDV